MCLGRDITKKAYSNILKVLQPKKGIFSDKKNLIFFIFLLETDCGYSLEPPWRGSNEYLKSNVFINIRKIMCTPVNPSFTM